MQFKTMLLPGLAVVAVLLVAGCAAGPNALVHTAGGDGHIAGFWLGLWHGFICPFTFLISLFSDRAHFYEVHNNGAWYNFGFLMGACMIFGGGAKGRKKNLIRA